MKNKKNYPMPDALDDTTSVVSSTDFTGLTPSLPEEDEIKSYSQIHQLPGNIKNN